MGNRFSIGRVLAEAWASGKARWPILLAAALLLGVGATLAVDGVLARLGLPVITGGGMAAARVYAAAGPLVMLGVSFVRFLTGALLTGALLAIAMAPAGAPIAPAEPLRLSLTALPAVFVARLVVGGTGLVFSIALLPRLASSDPSQFAMQTFALFMIAGLVSLIAMTLVGLAPAAAVAERLGPLAALRRAFALTRRRRLLLFGLLIAALTIQSLVVGTVGLAWPDMTTAALNAAPGWSRALWVLADAPFEILKALVGAAVFLELRRLVDPPLRETASVFD